MRNQNRLLTFGLIASLLGLTGCYWGRDGYHDRGGEGEHHERRGHDDGDRREGSDRHGDADH